MPGKSRPLRGSDRAGGGNRYSPYDGYGNQAPMRGNDYGYHHGGYGASPPSPHFGGGHNASPTKVYIRGLPFRVTAKEIEDFFAPITCAGIYLGVLVDG